MTDHQITRDRFFGFYRFIPDLIGLFLAAQLIFNKSFSYLFFWVGPVPVFVTEFLLLILAVTWLSLCLKQRRWVGVEDPVVFIPLALLWVLTLIGFIPAFHGTSKDLINAVKRGALGYYTSFAFLTYALLPDRKTVTRLMTWMFAGSVGGALISFPLDFFGMYKSVPFLVMSGIAMLTAMAFCFTYSALNPKLRWVGLIAGPFAAIQIVFGSRSAFVAIAVSILLVVFFLVKFRSLFFPRYHLWFAVLLGVMFISFVCFRGLPSAFDRLSFLVGVKDFLPHPVPPLPSTPPKVEVVEAPPSVPLPPVVPTVVPVVSSVPPSPSAPLPPVVTPPVEENVYKESQLMVLLEKHLFSRKAGGNVSWRLKVWFSGVAEVLSKHPLRGMGFSEPLIIRSMSPYKDPQRMAMALDRLKTTYDFNNRISNPKRNPAADIAPAPPLSMTPSEWTHFESYHWFGIDFHNSHIAFLYRLGLLGFSAYAFIIGLTMFRLWRSVHSVGSLSAVGFVFIVWYIIVAALNVVLEGPFLGAVFWIFVGAMLRLARAEKPVLFEKSSEFL